MTVCFLGTAIPRVDSTHHLSTSSVPKHSRRTESRLHAGVRVFSILFTTSNPMFAVVSFFLETWLKSVPHPLAQSRSLKPRIAYVSTLHLKFRRSRSLHLDDDHPRDDKTMDRTASCEQRRCCTAQAFYPPRGCNTAFNSFLSSPVPTCLLSEEHRGFKHISAHPLSPNDATELVPSLHQVKHQRRRDPPTWARHSPASEGASSGGVWEALPAQGFAERRRHPLPCHNFRSRPINQSEQSRLDSSQAQNTISQTCSTCSKFANTLKDFSSKTKVKQDSVPNLACAGGGHGGALDDSGQKSHHDLPTG